MVIFMCFVGKMMLLEGEVFGGLVVYCVMFVIYFGVCYFVCIVDEVLLYYGVDCLVVVIYCVSWFDEECVMGMLVDIVGKV